MLPVPRHALRWTCRWAGAALLGLWSGVALGQEVTLTLPLGADPDLTGLLNSASLTVQLTDAGDADAQDIVAAARADYRAILTGLYAAGHYGGSVSIRLDGVEAASLQPLDAPDRVTTVAITVDPGPQFTFGTVSLAPLATGTVLPEGFATGQVAAAEQVRDAVRTGVVAWRDLGHALARPGGQDLRANHPAARLDVAVTLDPGPRLRFGPVSVTGNSAVRTDRILEIAGLTEGRTFSPALLDLAATRLRRSGAFQSVALTEGDQIIAPDLLPIGLAVDEMAPRRFGFGAELSSVDGVSLSAFWLHRNILGGAERLRLDGAVTGVDGQTGGLDARVTLTFGRPATFAADTDLSVEAGWEWLDEPDYRLQQAYLEAGLIRYENPSFTWSVGMGALTAREQTPARTRDYTLITLPIEGTLDRRSDAFDPVSGYYLNLQLTPFLGIGDVGTGGRLLADGRVYRSFGADDRVTLALRGQVGTVLGPSLADAPADFLFYSGGGGTVRGQPYQALGIPTDAVDDDGDPLRTGGRFFAGLQAEARVQATDKIEIVGFTDWGLIDAGSTPGSDALFHGGAGVGVRYATGIGPIRVDLATPVTGDDAFGSVQLYIGIGQAF
jgi:translocation and assembly module TamA